MSPWLGATPPIGAGVDINPSRALFDPAYFMSLLNGTANEEPLPVYHDPNSLESVAHDAIRRIYDAMTKARGLP